MCQPRFSIPAARWAALWAIGSLAVVVECKIPGRQPPVLGWNTWCTQNECGKDWCSAQEVLSVGRSMKASGLLAAGYNRLHLDDCWGVRNPTTLRIEADPTRFPQGMAKFVSDVHQLGFRVGVYTDMGRDGCHAPFTGSWPYYEQDARDFAAWGIDYVKFDYCKPPTGFAPADLTANMSTALAASGRDIWFNFHCNWLTFEDARCAELGNSFRIAPDHIDRWWSTLKTSRALMERHTFWGPSDGPSHGYPDPDFVFTGGEGCGNFSAPGTRCPGQSDDEYRTEWSLNAIASGQLLFAADPRNMTLLQREVWLNQEILDVFLDTTGLSQVAMVSKETSQPVNPTHCGVRLMEQLSHGSCVLGQQFGCIHNNKAPTIWVADGCRALFECYGTPNVLCESQGDDVPSRENVTCSCNPPAPQVWVRPLASNVSASVAALLVNAADIVGDVTLHFEDVHGWTNETVADVRDLWKHTDVGSVTGRYHVQGLPPHGSIFLRLEKHES